MSNSPSPFHRPEPTDFDGHDELQLNYNDCQDCGEYYHNCVCDEDYYDGQPSEYDEWQDYYDGDDWDYGQYDEY